MKGLERQRDLKKTLRHLVAVINLLGHKMLSVGQTFLRKLPLQIKTADLKKIMTLSQ